jgi:DNA-binding MurR/RpiR family transcriptional regulator
MTKNISQLIYERSCTFSKSQKKIAAAVMNDYDKVAYMTASKLAAFAGVSESTVVRFACELGFDGYQEFRRAVVELIKNKLTPNQRIEVTKQRFAGKDTLTQVMESDIAKLRFTLDNIDKESFSDAITAILGARKIYVAGARSSEPLARMLSHNLSLIFDNVRLLQVTTGAEVFEQMFSVSEQDVFIAFSFPRYSSKIINAVKFARQRGAKVIAVTDSASSPIAESASYHLIAQSDMASFMDSLVAPLSIINAIIVELTGRLEKTIRERFDSLEQIWDEYEVYTKR